MNDASKAVNLGADALGFVFYEKSPRCISKKTARNIIDNLPPFVSSVGVFVDEKRQIIQETADFCGLDVLQFHGSESPDFCSLFRKRTIKAFKIRTREDIEAIPSYKVSAVLLDTYYEDIHGGGGKTFNWQFAIEAKNFCEHLILAGGLAPDNVAGAIKMVEPYGIDISSGVEAEPGKKDPALLEDFMRSAKMYKQEKT